ncbi:hypothetical protein MBAV_006086 [Candidatus Magnetobacterium bavaricum]|uniref:Uncharacterized protein n=1 Tax=Candidatus Magnetobacterium bavaricum TaxID=29290 RepID=A0A0F3GIF2_9BACT|nr:hypothetical protein MBAV_006086 [Candidatus Magnetobacterium bavaricum]
MVESAFNRSDIAFDERINALQRAIDNKISSGQLPPKQASSINIALSKIRDAKAHGRLTPQKIRKLNAALDRLERRLNNPKHRYR